MDKISFTVNECDKGLFFWSIETVYRFKLNSVNVWSPKMKDCFRELELLILKQENCV